MTAVIQILDSDQIRRGLCISSCLALGESRNCDRIVADVRLCLAVEEHFPFVHLLSCWEPAEA
jgi:hypothetical protein